MSELKFNFSMPVWGERYVNVFLNAALPTQLSQENLPKFPFLKDSLYEFYTTQKDAKIIMESPQYQVLASLMETKFIYLDDLIAEKQDKKWGILRHCHRESAKSGDARNAAVYYLCPDQIWSEGSLSKAALKIAEGYSVVLSPGLRTIEETIIPSLRKQFLFSDGAISLSSRDLVKLGIEHLHPEMKAWFWDAPNYWKVPTYILFEVLNEGISAFCYILHPVVLNPEVKHAPFKHIFDQDYLEAACPNFKKHYIPVDSDEICYFEISPKDSIIPGIPREASRLDPVSAMAWYGEFQYNKQHRELIKNPIRLHYTDISTEKWGKVEERGKSYVRKIEKTWLFPDYLLLFTHPRNYYRRLLGRYRFTDPKDIPLLKSIFLKLFQEFEKNEHNIVRCKNGILSRINFLLNRIRKILFRNCNKGEI